MSNLTIPLDDTSLTLLEEALDAALDGDGAVVGAEFTLSRLLDFWSGYDPAKLVQCGENVYEYPEPTLHYTDLIRALVAEIRRLRG